MRGGLKLYHALRSFCLFLGCLSFANYPDRSSAWDVRNLGVCLTSFATSQCAHNFILNDIPYILIYCFVVEKDGLVTFSFASLASFSMPEAVQSKAVQGNAK